MIKDNSTVHIPTYLTRKSAAEHLDCSKATLDRRTLAGDIPKPVRVAGLLRFKTADLIEAGLIDPRVFAAADAVAASLAA